MSANVTIKYRPLRQWTDPVTEPRPSLFTATWSDTVELLRQEVYAISRSNYPDVVIEIDVGNPRNINSDGALRSGARVLTHGVVVSFESTHGPLRYACDTFIGPQWKRSPLDDWQHNVRAVAKGLHALRMVSQYGIGVRGEQYTGWAAIGSGMPMGAGARAGWSVENAMAMLGLRGDIDAATVSRARAELARIHHPDLGGVTEQMQQINAAADWLLNNAV